MGSSYSENTEIYKLQKLGMQYTNFIALSNPADAQDVSCLGLCGRDICPRSYASYGLGTVNPKMSVSI